MEPNKVLSLSIDFANKELVSFKKENRLTDTYSLVLASIFRKIIELSDGVRVCAESGLRGPAEISFRGLIEAFLALKYIIQDKTYANDRAIAYKLSYHKHQVESANYLLKHQAVDKNTKLRYQEMIRNNLAIVEKDEFKDVLAEYDNLQAKDKRGHIPKWHSLNGGPKSINQLAEHFKENRNDKERGVVAELYSFLSVGAHNYLALRDAVIDDLGNTILRDTRYLTDPNSNEYNLETVRAILTSSIIKFTYNAYYEYHKTEEFGDFVNTLKKHIVNKK